MSKDIVIDIGTCGSVEALHDDAFDLAFLGDKRVHRQCDIRFDEVSQRWDIFYLPQDGWGKRTPLTGFPTYESARDAEVQWLNACRISGLHPMSDAGLAIAKLVKETTYEAQ